MTPGLISLEDVETYIGVGVGESGNITLPQYSLVYKYFLMKFPYAKAINKCVGP